MVTPRDSCTPCKREGCGGPPVGLFPASLAQPCLAQRPPQTAPSLPPESWPPWRWPSTLPSQPSLGLGPLSHPPALTPSWLPAAHRSWRGWETMMPAGKGSVAKLGWAPAPPPRDSCVSPSVSWLPRGSGQSWGAKLIHLDPHPHSLAPRSTVGRTGCPPGPGPGPGLYPS